MLVSFFKTPRHKKFTYRPLYAKEGIKSEATVGVDGLLVTKRIRFKRNTMVQTGATRNLIGLRFAGLFAAILGLSGAMVGNSEWRQISYALILFAGWVGWRLFRPNKPSIKSHDPIQGSHG